MSRAREPFELAARAELPDDGVAAERAAAARATHEEAEVAAAPGRGDVLLLGADERELGAEAGGGARRARRPRPARATGSSATTRRRRDARTACSTRGSGGGAAHDDGGGRAETGGGLSGAGAGGASSARSAAAGSIMSARMSAAADETDAHESPASARRPARAVEHRREIEGPLVGGLRAHDRRGVDVLARGQARGPADEPGELRLDVGRRRAARGRLPRERELGLRRARASPPIAKEKSAAARRAVRADAARVGGRRSIFSRVIAAARRRNGFRPQRSLMAGHEGSEVEWPPFGAVACGACCPRWAVRPALW